jgi:uncharacterized OsmC-like protein
VTDNVINIDRAKRYTATTLAIEVSIKRKEDGSPALFIPHPGAEFDGWGLTPDEARRFAAVLVEQAAAAEASQ